MAVAATAIWRVRPSGSNANGGGFDAAISGAGTDYSQQDAAQASGSAGTASGTTAFSDAAAVFTAAMVGNAIRITSGSGFTAGWYFVVGYTSATAITLDRSPGTGSAAVWKLGGGWADFWTNCTSSGPLVPGNTVYILGSGIPNPASYTYDYSPPSYFNPTSGTDTTGAITFAGDPATPSGGVPCIKTPGLMFQAIGMIARNLWLVVGGTTFGSYGTFASNSATVTFSVQSVVHDQFGYDVGITGAGANFGISVIGGEVFSSVAKRSTNNNAAVYVGQFAGCAIGVNVHDCIGPGIYNSDMGNVLNCIIAKNGGYGLYCNDASNDRRRQINAGNTIDGNSGGGIIIQDQTILAGVVCYNNIISNHITAGTYGISVGAGTTTVNDGIKRFVDYNTFYNNTTSYNAISAGAHDTALATDPYVASSTEDYTLA